MEDRANVYVTYSDKEPGVYLYTHWLGTELPLLVQEALKKQVRWNDTSYLTRIIFDTMTEGCHGQETGFGISSYVGDGENRVINVIVEENIISIRDEIWTFQEYIELPSSSLQWKSL
jgi:hypothetical protein